MARANLLGYLCRRRVSLAMYLSLRICRRESVAAYLSLQRYCKFSVSVVTARRRGRHAGPCHVVKFG